MFKKNADLVDDGTPKLRDKVKLHQSHSGWGNTGGVEEISTDKLQETEVLIVPTGNCVERINQTEGVDEDLIVCAGAGPCKVGHRRYIHLVGIVFNLG